MNSVSVVTVLAPGSQQSVNRPLLLLRDTFTGIDATSLADHAPNYAAVVGNWTVDTGTAVITSNAADLGAATPDIVVHGVGRADHVLTVDVTPGNGNRIGTIFRFASNASFAFLELSGDVGAELQLRYFDGAYNTVDSAAYTWGAGTREMRIESLGTTITCYVDGVQQVSGTVSQAATATNVGLWGWQWGTAVADNFRVRSW